MASFVEQYGLYSDDDRKRIDSIIAQWSKEGVEFVRFVFPDQHGQLRGKTLVREAAVSAFRTGVNMTTTLLAKDTSHKTVFPVFSRGGGFSFPGMEGAADFVMVPDPWTAKRLPWARNTAWVLCDPYMNNGKVSPLGTRRHLQRATACLAEQGYQYITGLEVEFHVFRRLDDRMELADSGQPGRAPEIGLMSHGYQYLTEQRYDSVSEIMELFHDTLMGLKLPLRSLEIEYGPSQFELTFGPTTALEAADNMVLLRTALKQVCQRRGLLASFMCRPAIPNAMSSGWHLHQSLTDRSDNRNLFMPEQDDRCLSRLGEHFLAGLLHHAPGCTAFSTPTINGYRRYRPMSLAPDRAAWGQDNRGAMLRVLGSPGDPGSRIENRVGEPSANPYLYIASQAYAGLSGITDERVAPPSADEPYQAEAVKLPTNLYDALQAVRTDRLINERFGEDFIGYYCHIKEAELARFNLEVTEWETREYLDMF